MPFVFQSCKYLLTRNLKDFLSNFISLSPTQREISEKLEQLRVIETDKIGISVIKEEILGVDTQEDLDRVNRLIYKK